MNFIVNYNFCCQTILPNFGNARAVRNLFEKTLDKHAVRVVNEHATVDKLTADDVPDIEKRHN